MEGKVIRKGCKKFWHQKCAKKQMIIFASTFKNTAFKVRAHIFLILNIWLFSKDSFWCILGGICNSTPFMQYLHTEYAFSATPIHQEKKCNQSINQSCWKSPSHECLKASVLSEQNRFGAKESVCLFCYTTIFCCCCKTLHLMQINWKWGDKCLEET